MTPIRFISAAALAASLALPLAASAQQAPPAPPAGAPAQTHHRGAHYMRALRNLNLSDAQRQKIRSAIAQMRQTNQNADPQTRRANVHQLRSQIDAMLTPDQRTQLHAQLRTQRKNGEAPQGGAPPHA
jgi:Spy/CpxP family protein refolding chaperone